MAVILTQDRKRKAVNALNGIVKQRRPKIRVVASCIELIAASFPAVPFGPLPLYFRYLGREKSNALKASRKLGKRRVISEAGKTELGWWFYKILTASEHQYKDLTQHCHSKLTSP